MIVQIYTMQSAQEALAVVEAGADHIGFTPSAIGLPGEIDVATAQAIVAAVGTRATRVALTVDANIDAILAMTRAVQPDMLHLCGPTAALRPDAVGIIRAQLPNVRIMQAISVDGLEAIDEARAFEPVADVILLDTTIPEIPGIGASGKTHDWNISRAIVQAVRLPVILAGGLSPENVAEAIRVVQPWGVDSLTHTNEKLPDGSVRKHIERVRQFAVAAKGTQG